MLVTRAHRLARNPRVEGQALRKARDLAEVRDSGQRTLLSPRFAQSRQLPDGTDALMLWAWRMRQKRLRTHGKENDVNC